MKKLILLTCLLIFACSNGLFAQDYMEMRKKQLRIEYQKKIDLINTLTKNQDSLSSSNVKLESNLLTLKNYLKKINDSIVRLKSKNENLNSILIENEEKTSNLEREIYSLKDSVSELKKIIEFNVNKSLDELRNSSNFETFLSYFIFSTCSEQNIDSLIASSSPLIMKFIDSNIQFGRFYNQGITCTLYNSSDYGYNDYYGDSFPKMSNESSPSISSKELISFFSMLSNPYLSCGSKAIILSSFSLNPLRVEYNLYSEILLGSGFGSLS